MKIILSPAKKMNVDTDTLAAESLPVFLEDTKILLKWMQGQSYEELKNLWKCNDKIAGQNVERIKDMELEKGLTPALLSYEGLAYQYMAPAVFEDGHIDYVQKHLRILSAFYGAVKPLDGVTPYRLEMQAKGEICGYKNLYEFWGRKLYDQVKDESGIIINLASKEYSRCVEKYLEKEDTFITCLFMENSGGKLVQKGTYAKMARGEMVRFMAEQHLEEPEGMKSFNRLGFHFRDDISTETEYVFERI